MLRYFFLKQGKKYQLCGFGTYSHQSLTQRTWFREDIFDIVKFEDVCPVHLLVLVS